MVSGKPFILGADKDDDPGLLVIADHASAYVPPNIDLGLTRAQLKKHIAVDIGTDALARRVARLRGCTAIIAAVSRLVVDCNRPPDDPGAIPRTSDGHDVPGNQRLSVEERTARIQDFHAPYHDAISAHMAAASPKLIVSIHSFTPSLESRPEEQRPWEAGILYNRDARAARPAIAALEAEDLTVGDNQPYSGEFYGYTTDRHGEARGVPYIFLEVRQDLLVGDTDIENWAKRCDRIIDTVITEIMN